MRGAKTAEFTAELCLHLHKTGFFCATEIPLIVKGAHSAQQRADVYAIKTHEFARKDVRIYEVKTSRSDYLKDVDAGKAESYTEHARRVYYAVPQGLVKKSEVPDGIGLIVGYPSGFKVLQAPKPGPCVEPSADLLLLMMARWREYEPEAHRLRSRVNWEDGVELADRAKSLGYDIASKVRNGSGRSYREKAALAVFDMVEKAIGKQMPEHEKRKSRGLRSDSFEYEAEGLAHLAVAMLEDAERFRKVSGYLGALGSTWNPAKLSQLAKTVDRLP